LDAPEREGAPQREGFSRAASMAPIDRAQAYVLQAQLHAFHGDMAPAIAALEQAKKIADAQVPVLTLQLNEALGVAHLHKAEQDNGLYDRSSELDRRYRSRPSVC
jgi:hypothetical protein